MQKNILILHTDAHMQRWLGIAGNSEIHTPHLDRLAREGVYFPNAQTCSGVCVPARAALMTGRYPIGNGVTCGSQKLSSSEKTMGQYFAEAGYETGYFGKTSFGVGKDVESMARHGWQKYFSVEDYNSYLQENGLGVRYPERKITESRSRYWNLGQSSIPEEHYFEKVLTDRTLEFLQASRKKPFLCMTSWIAPHGPFTPPGRFAKMHDPAKLTLAPRSENELDDKPEEFVRWVLQNQKYVNDNELRDFLALIYGMIALVDEQVGRIMDSLRQHGLLENTLILFTCDHGDFGTGYGIFGKSWNMIDSLIRIPLIVRAPGNKPQVFHGLVENIDLLPTMLEYSGMSVPSSIQGRSFWSLLKGQTFEAKPASFAFNTYESSRFRLAQSTIRSGNWRLIVGEKGPDQLYDVLRDPWNLSNVAAAHPEVANELRGQLLRWQIGAVGLGYNRETAKYWDDETLFWDETRFTGERINSITA